MIPTCDEGRSLRTRFVPMTAMGAPAATNVAQRGRVTTAVIIPGAKSELKSTIATGTTGAQPRIERA